MIVHSRLARKALPLSCFLSLPFLLLFLFYFSLDNARLPSTGMDAGRFPRKIWQTWRVDPLNLDERDLPVARSWTAKNPGHRYEMLTDQNDMQYVETHFGPHGVLYRPDIVHTYQTLTAKIIKADLLRYLVMYIEGGVYADIDVEALRPVERFIPPRFSEGEMDLVVGVEIDEPDLTNHRILGKKSQSFCQWTFMAKPRLPALLRLIDRILAWLNRLAEQQHCASIADVHLDFDEVIKGTGPSAFTDAVMAEISLSVGHLVSWYDTFHDLQEPRLMGRVLVLTVEAFAAGQGHSDSGDHNSRAALVRHHYHASGWPSVHPRFNHPMYGEVEACNWNKECVRRWDEDTAAFDSLSPREQEHRLAVKHTMKASAADIESEVGAKPQDLIANLEAPVEAT